MPTAFTRPWSLRRTRPRRRRCCAHPRLTVLCDPPAAARVPNAAQRAGDHVAIVLGHRWPGVSAEHRISHESLTGPARGGRPRHGRERNPLAAVAAGSRWSAPRQRRHLRVARAHALVLCAVPPRRARRQDPRGMAGRRLPAHADRRTAQSPTRASQPATSLASAPITRPNSRRAPRRRLTLAKIAPQQRTPGPAARLFRPGARGRPLRSRRSAQLRDRHGHVRPPARRLRGAGAAGPRALGHPAQDIHARAARPRRRGAGAAGARVRQRPPWRRVAGVLGNRSAVRSSLGLESVRGSSPSTLRSKSSPVNVPGVALGGCSRSGAAGAGRRRRVCSRFRCPLSSLCGVPCEGTYIRASRRPCTMATGPRRLGERAATEVSPPTTGDNDRPSRTAELLSTACRAAERAGGFGE